MPASYQPFQVGQYSYAPAYPSSRSERAPLDYIHWLHHNCVRALLGHPSYTIPNPRGRSMEVHKDQAMKFFTWSGVKWPTAFARDSEIYTMSRSVGEGLKYTELIIK